MTLRRAVMRWLAPAGVAGLALAIAACNSKTGPTSPKSTGTAVPVGPVEIGSPLYIPAKPAAMAATPGGNRPEPIVIQQSTIQFDEKVVLSAQVDGIVELVAQPLKKGVAYDPKDPAYGGRLVAHPRDDKWWHYRWYEGDDVTEGQVLALLDDSQAILQRDSLVASADAAKLAYEQSQKSEGGYKEALAKLDKVGLAASGLERIKYEIEFNQSQITTARIFQEFTKYDGDAKIAEDRWRRHKVKSPFTGKIVTILRGRNETVKVGDAIIEVKNTARFRVEGKLEWQEAEKLQPYTPVTVEPIRSASPEPYSAVKHRQEVTGVAVTAHPGRPLIVSTSNDGTAIVWDVTGANANAPHGLQHPGGLGVRCVAVTADPKATQHLVATGCSDGKIRLFDVTRVGDLPEKPTYELEESHGQAVTALAFSTDGKYLASAAGRDVFVWDLESRKKKYALPAEHRDDVKSLRFTPQATLVTVCRDKAVRVWNLGTDGGSVLRSMDHRSGSIDVLGISADGSRVLFDQDSTRIDLVRLADSRTTGSLMNTGGGIRFGGMALFGADDKFIVTATGDADTKGELQLWVAAESGRASERRRLITQFRTAVTCAAFSPDAKFPFVVAGTQTGAVHFWKLPDPAEQSVLKGRIISVSRQDPRTGDVRVEVENPQGKLNDLLSDRGIATIIIDRNAKPEAPTMPMGAPAPAPAPAPLPVGKAKGDDGVVPAGGRVIDPTNGGLLPATGTVKPGEGK